MFGMVLAIASSSMTQSSSLRMSSGSCRSRVCRRGMPPVRRCARFQARSSASRWFSPPSSSPMGMAAGSVGAIYRQFTLSMSVSILFSAFLALTLTPALCATLLKPGQGHARSGFFGWFNRRFESLTARYTGGVGWVLRRGGRMLVVYAALLVVLGLGYSRVPTSFVPEEDQGNFMAMFELPAGATAERTRKVVAAYEAYTATRPDIAESTVILGFGFSGSGPNAAQAFTSLKDWGERNTTVNAEIAAAEAAMADIPEGTAMIMKPAGHRIARHHIRFRAATGGPRQFRTGRAEGGRGSIDRAGIPKPSGDRRNGGRAARLARASPSGLIARRR